MNSKDVVVYRPLVEVIDFNGNKYYTEGTIEDLQKNMESNERIWFDFSNRGVRTSQIVSWGPADTEDIMIIWETKNLTNQLKRTVESLKKQYLENNGGAKKITYNILMQFIEKAKKEALGEKEEITDKQEELLQKKMQAIEIYKTLSEEERGEIKRQATDEVKASITIPISDTLLNTFIQAKINLLVQKKYVS